MGYRADRECLSVVLFACSFVPPGLDRNNEGPALRGLRVVGRGGPATKGMMQLPGEVAAGISYKLLNCGGAHNDQETAIVGNTL